MVIYTCPTCKDEYNNICHYRKHLAKNSCKKSNVGKKITIHECKECGKKFDKKYSHDRHVKLVHPEIIINNNRRNINDNKIDNDNNIANDNKIGNDNNIANDIEHNNDINNANINNLVKYVKKKPSATLRNTIWNTYMGAENKKGKCLCCSDEDISCANFICGHVVAEFKGGDLSLSNLRPICALCNSSMGTRNMEEYIIKHGLKINPNWNGYETKNKNCNKLTNIIIKLVNEINKSEKANEETSKINSCLSSNDRVLLVNLVNKTLSPNDKIMNKLGQSLGLKNNKCQEINDYTWLPDSDQMLKNKIMIEKEILERLLILLLKKKQITIEIKESLINFINETYNIKHLNVITNLLSKANCFNDNTDITIDTVENEIKNRDEEDSVIDNIFMNIKPVEKTNKKVL